jgi:hypothetical protein
VNLGLVANTRVNFGTFELFAAGSSFTMSGGTVNLVQASVAATPVDYRVLSTAVNISGGTLNVGSVITAANFNFRIAGSTPSIVIDNTTNNKTATFLAQTLIYGNVTVNAGTTYDLNGFLVATLGSTFTNNGTVTGTTAGSRFYFLGNGLAQTYLIWERALLRPRKQSISPRGTGASCLFSLATQRLLGTGLTCRKATPPTYVGSGSPGIWNFTTSSSGASGEAAT